MILSKQQRINLPNMISKEMDDEDDVPAESALDNKECLDDSDTAIDDHNAMIYIMNNLDINAENALDLESHLNVPGDTNNTEVSYGDLESKF